MWSNRLDARWGTKKWPVDSDRGDEGWYEWEAWFGTVLVQQITTGLWPPCEPPSRRTGAVQVPRTWRGWVAKEESLFARIAAATSSARATRRVHFDAFDFCTA